MNDCLFCRIANGQLETVFVAESELVVAFDDIAPVAPTHVLIVPRQHLDNVSRLRDGPPGLAQAMLELATDIAALRKVDASGYRLVVNTGSDGGQTVGHLHLHLLGGRPMNWPPG